MSSKSSSPRSVEKSPRTNVKKDEEKIPEEEMEVDESPTRESVIMSTDKSPSVHAEKSRTNKSHSEKQKLIKTEPSKNNTTINAQTNSAEHSACPGTPKSKRSSLGRSKELGLKIEDLLNKSAGELEKSPGNKENEKLEVPEGSKENLEFAISTVTRLTRQSLSLAVAERKSLRAKPNSKLDEQKLLQFSVGTPLPNEKSRNSSDGTDRLLSKDQPEEESAKLIEDDDSSEVSEPLHAAGENLDSDEVFTASKEEEEKNPLSDDSESDAKTQQLDSKQLYVRLEKTIVDDMDIFEEVRASDCKEEVKMPSDELCFHDQVQEEELETEVKDRSNINSRSEVNEREEQENNGSLVDANRSSNDLSNEVDENNCQRENDELTRLVSKNDNSRIEIDESKEQQKIEGSPRLVSEHLRVEENTDETVEANESNDNSVHKINEIMDLGEKDRSKKMEAMEETDEIKIADADQSDDNSLNQRNSLGLTRCVFENEELSEETNEIKIVDDIQPSGNSGKIETDGSENQQISVIAQVEGEINKTLARRLSLRCFPETSTSKNDAIEKFVNTENNGSTLITESSDANINTVNETGENEYQEGITKLISSNDTVVETINKTMTRRQSLHQNPETVTTEKKTTEQFASIENNESAPIMKNSDPNINTGTNTINLTDEEEDLQDNNAITQPILSNNTVERTADKTPSRRQSLHHSPETPASQNEIKVQSVNAENEEGNDGITRPISTNDKVDEEPNKTLTRRLSSQADPETLTAKNETIKQSVTIHNIESVEETFLSSMEDEKNEKISSIAAAVTIADENQPEYNALEESGCSTNKLDAAQETNTEETSLSSVKDAREASDCMKKRSAETSVGKRESLEGEGTGDNISGPNENTISSTVAEIPAVMILGENRPVNNPTEKPEENGESTREEDSEKEKAQGEASQHGAAFDDGESDVSIGALFQDVSADEWEKRKKKRSAPSELNLRNKEVAADENNSFHSLSTERLGNDSETDCDFVLVDEEMRQVAEADRDAKKKSAEYDFDSDDTVVLQRGKDSSKGEKRKESAAKPNDDSDDGAGDRGSPEQEEPANENQVNEGDDASKKPSAVIISRETIWISDENVDDDDQADMSDSQGEDGKSLRESRNVEEVSPKKSGVLTSSNCTILIEDNDDVKESDSDESLKPSNRSWEAANGAANRSREKVPQFLLDVSSSDSENGGRNASIDSDIAREYNLDGNSDLEYSDDNVPADDCRASESEYSDSEDDGADLADFVVESDELSEGESEEEEEEEEEESNVKKFKRIVSYISSDDEEDGEMNVNEETEKENNSDEEQMRLVIDNSLSDSSEQQKTPKLFENNRGRSINLEDDVNGNVLKTLGTEYEEMDTSQDQNTPKSFEKNREQSINPAGEVNINILKTPGKESGELNVSAKQKTPKSSNKNRKESINIAEEVDVYTFETPSKEAKGMNMSKKQKTLKSSEKNREGSKNSADKFNFNIFKTPGKEADEMNVTKKQKTPKSSKKNREELINSEDEVNCNIFKTPEKEPDEMNVSKKQKTPKSSKKNREGSISISEEVVVRTFKTPIKEAEQMNISKKQKSVKSSMKCHDQSVRIVEALTTPKVSELNKSLPTPNNDTPATKFLRKERLNESLPPLSKKTKAFLRKSTLNNLIQDQSLNIPSTSGGERKTFQHAEDRTSSYEEDDDEEDLEKNEKSEDGEEEEEEDVDEEEEEDDEEEEEDVDEEEVEDVNEEESDDDDEEEDEEEDGESSDEEEVAHPKKYPIKHLQKQKINVQESRKTTAKKQRSNGRGKRITEETDDESSEEEVAVVPRKNKNKKQIKILAEERKEVNDSKKRAKLKRAGEEEDYAKKRDKQSGRAKNKRLRENTSEAPEAAKKFKRTVKTEPRQNDAMSDSDDAPESVTFAAARSSALRVVESAAAGIKAAKETRKRKRKERRERSQKEKLAGSKELAQPLSKSSLTRLPEEVLESLTDVQVRPRKRQKLSKAEERIVPSKQMFGIDVTAPAEFRTNTVSAQVSFAGSTARFDIVKVRKERRKAAEVASIRKKLLARNQRQPVAAFLMYRAKLKASEKNAFSR